MFVQKQKFKQTITAQSQTISPFYKRKGRKVQLISHLKKMDDFI
jgi:hypothetical protein